MNIELIRDAVTSVLEDANAEEFRTVEDIVDRIIEEIEDNS